jgi:hypothetical protein
MIKDAFLSTSRGSHSTLLLLVRPLSSSGSRPLLYVCLYARCSCRPRARCPSVPVRMTRRLATPARGSRQLSSTRRKEITCEKALITVIVKKFGNNSKPKF